jgi:hypothetical protein
MEARVIWTSSCGERGKEYVSHVAGNKDLSTFQLKEILKYSACICRDSVPVPPKFKTNAIKYNYINIQNDVVVPEEKQLFLCV